ncbi:hypothetical protein niasHT_030741 [Heterodera trifolii]|uniref:Uncharacterized protein n=1 Tax=Heterodera trifolii TaxID=157864 RepID=A0ABD2HSY3_9BILA
MLFPEQCQCRAYFALPATDERRWSVPPPPSSCPPRLTPSDPTGTTESHGAISAELKCPLVNYAQLICEKSDKLIRVLGHSETPVICWHLRYYFLCRTDFSALNLLLLWCYAPPRFAFPRHCQKGFRYPATPKVR